MLWSPRLSLSNFHVKLTAKGLFRNLQLLSGCRKTTVVFHAVDKNKTRGAPRAPPQTGSTAHSGGPNQLPQPDLVPAVPVPMPPRPALVEDKPAAAAQNQWEKKNQCVQQLRRLLAQGNRRIEALATVVQHLFSEREDALKLKKGLSLELANLRDELVSSSQCCERLQKEKEEVHASLEEAVGRLQEEHQAELTGLEERLRAFYQAEWDKVHQAYQEEADKCRALMEQQLEEMRCRQEALRKEQEASHAQQMDNLKLTYNTSVQELRRTQEQDLENLDKTLKETEATLNEKIQDLTSENEVLSEKLRAEEERRILAEKNQKDSHVLYLQQELESLKVVLEIKTTQLHQQDKKLMQMDKLVEANVKLEERLNKVQQENEDYRARMDKHTALSRQLSSEQAVLQQTLQKESKVNKRLSMENEELLWKLHNGDLASPRRLSPSSPFHSPRNSASFPNTAAPLSPTR
uniref:Microtubule associated tumor suppressor 1b n=1 Tax=Esox lucius TaxID=8010 RepID=A0AAY5K1H1_ESOLU